MSELISEAIQAILQTFEQRGDEKYADEGVTQLQHALQTADLARAEKADESLIVAALLHDFGHISSSQQLPGSREEDLDDKHEDAGFKLLNRYFGAAIADPIRLHVAAKRYLCTVQPEYQHQLSPTSLKSFYDQGGVMNEREKVEFECEPHFLAAVQLRRWDDQAKDPDASPPALESYVPLMERLLADNHFGR